MDLSEARSDIQLSVVIPTTQPWPFVRDCLLSLCAQAKAVGAEIILAEGNQSVGSEDFIVENTNIRRLRVPGASIFELRARGISAARGEIIALTEDHCLVAPDWCRAIISAHEISPSSLAVGGSVENGATRRLMDRASFHVTFGPFLAPFESGLIKRTPTPANIAFKRSVIPKDGLDPGWFEMVLNPQLWRDGVVALDEQIKVRHVQSHGFLGTCAAHFHNGRSTTGLIVPRMNRAQRRARVRSCFRLPVRIVRDTLKTLRQKEVSHPEIAKSLPFVCVLALCHALGELTGLIKGPGKSPERLQ